MGGSRPARRAVRAHPTAVAGVFLAQAHRQPDHARVRRYRPAVGLPGVRRRGRVIVARDALGTWNSLAFARLETRLSDDPAGAVVLLADLPAQRGHHAAVHMRVAQAVARDGRT